MRSLKLVVAGLTLAAATFTLTAAAAKETFEKVCANCHGIDGKGDTKMGKKLEIKDFTDAKYQDSFKDDKAITVIKEGFKDGDKIKMKAYDELSADEIKALVAYIRAFKK